MPELPEVETIKNDLAGSVTGAEITGFDSCSPKQIIPSEKIVKENIVGAKIIGVERRGKVIMIVVKYQGSKVLRGEKYLLIHLKMSGKLFLRSKNKPEDKYVRAKLILRLSNKSGLYELRFCDTRKFGYIKLLNSEIKKDNFFNKYGVEPLSAKFSTEYLIGKLKNCKRSIKAVIMDQEIVTGVGNIYANESLFLAGINPNKPAYKMRNSEIVKLLKSIKTVLNKGIEFRGSSSKDRGYVDLFGKYGSYQDHFLVYEKKEKKCRRCGNVIRYQKVSGRGTFWCFGCQK